MKFSITFAFLAVAVTVKALATRPNIALEHNKAVGRREYLPLSHPCKV